MWFSNEQYKRDMSKFNWIRRQPEVNYGRLRDDKYGKGLNTITKEKLEREKKCFEDGMRFWTPNEIHGSLEARGKT